MTCWNERCGPIWCIAPLPGIGDEKVPDAKTLARLGQLMGPKVIEQLHQRVVELAQERGVTRGRKLRVDTTVDVATLCYTSLSL